jgi:hypothetical protein
MNYPDGRPSQDRPKRVKAPKPAKYRNKKTWFMGILFDSKNESLRYQELLLLEQAGTIRAIEVQPRYDLIVNDQKLGYYKGDFRYIVCATGESILEDVKAPPTRTAVYQLKKKLIKAIYGIDIIEIMY